MLNYYHHTSTVAPAYPQEVHEHRAPTDDSMRMLDEMRQKAMQSIIDRFPHPSNALKAEWVVYREHQNWEYVYRCLYELNGNKMEFKHIMDDCKIRNLNEAMEELMDAFAKHLAMHFVKDLIKEIEGKRYMLDGK